VAAIPFVDSHVHFHDLAHPPLRYAWLESDAELDPIVGDDRAIRSQRYWAEDFCAESRFHNVSQVVHVQAAIGTPDPVSETSWLQEMADRVGAPHGIIGYVNLAGQNARADLERHRQFSNFRGVRDLRYDGYLTDASWRAGYRSLEGLVCCDDPFLEQTHIARELAESAPRVTLCIDHAGFPGWSGPHRRLPGNDKHWRKAMRDLARADSVVVKISGLGMSDHSWTVESIRPWVLECIEAFGVARSFFGTNWPLDRLYSSYGDVTDAYGEIIGDFTDAEQHALFHGNAQRIFRLREDAPR
jgi:predicted TIM-barrel fold metal-dependent hydrolase